VEPVGDDEGGRHKLGKNDAINRKKGGEQGQPSPQNVVQVSDEDRN